MHHQISIDLDDITHVPKVHRLRCSRFAVDDISWWTSDRFYDTPVDAGQPDRVNASTSELREDLGVDLPAEDHLCEL